MYLIILSNNTKISIDADELPGVYAAIGTRNLVRVRQGIFNPAYLVAVVEDSERRKNHLEDQKYEEKRVRIEDARVKDIFSKIDELASRKEATKAITGGIINNHGKR